MFFIRMEYFVVHLFYFFFFGNNSIVIQHISMIIQTINIIHQFLCSPLNCVTRERTSNGQNVCDQFDIKSDFCVVFFVLCAQFW